MFTGIIETMGELVKVEKEQTNLHFHIRSNLAKELKIDIVEQELKTHLGFAFIGTAPSKTDLPHKFEVRL